MKCRENKEVTRVVKCEKKNDRKKENMKRKGRKKDRKIFVKKERIN